MNIQQKIFIYLFLYLLQFSILSKQKKIGSHIDSRDPLLATSLSIMHLQDVQLTTCIQVSACVTFPVYLYGILHYRRYMVRCVPNHLGKWFEWMLFKCILVGFLIPSGNRVYIASSIRFCYYYKRRRTWSLSKSMKEQRGGAVRVHCCLIGRRFWVQTWWLTGPFCVLFASSICVWVSFLWAVQLPPIVHGHAD